MLSNTILFDIHDMLMHCQLRVKSNTQAFYFTIVCPLISFISPLLVVTVKQFLFNLKVLKTDGFENNTNLFCLYLVLGNS